MAYLLVAEVDKIQSFVLESAKLRQVVGASALLKDFGKNVKSKPEEYLGEFVPEKDIIASAGGSFRILFPSEETAIAAGIQLQKKFQADVGGSITIAEPVPWDDDETIIEIGNSYLREAKTRGKDPAPLWHIPYMAQCQSSGVELAYAYDSETGIDGDNKKYLGELTIKKGKRARQKPTLVDEMAEAMNVRADEQSKDADAYAWDDRKYVAYLVADGNQMGKIFNACLPEQVTKLSTELATLTQDALVDATQQLTKRFHEKSPRRDSQDIQDYLPILPLIMGGDDVFALMPANWAFDVARRYCDLYEEKVNQFLEASGIKQRIGGDYKATLGAAIVICKASYPYKVAHEYGESLLSSVKGKGKTDPENPISMLGIGWIVGSQVTDEDEVPAFESRDAAALIHYRYQLRDMPSRIRERLRRAIENGLALREEISQLPRAAQSRRRAVLFGQRAINYEDLPDK